MSTRRTSSNELNQERWCSSTEFNQGTINALFAAKRIALIDDPELRELLWFIQYRSLSPGGVAGLAEELLKRHPDRVGTPLIRMWNAVPRREVSPRELILLREELPEEAHYLTVNVADLFDSETKSPIWTDEITRPFRAGIDGLPRYLIRLCLDPEWRISMDTSPWWFRDLLGAIKALRRSIIDEARQRMADTIVTRKMRDALDFCYRRRRMVFIEGAAGIGRTATLQAWCDEHAGMVRYVEVPSSNDDRSFYAKIAEALGVARGLSYNGQQIKLRVEETLRASGLVIALDESQYVWPQYIRPRGIPSRLLWIKTAFDAGTPFAVVAHSDFSKWQELYVKKTLWTDEQWERRLNRKVFLPSQHTAEDMKLIARAKLPQGDERCWKLLAGYALATEKKQASGITELLESAYDRATAAGRSNVIFEDIVVAIESDHLPFAAISERAATSKDDCKDDADGLQPVGGAVAPRLGKRVDSSRTAARSQSRLNALSPAM